MDDFNSGIGLTYALGVGKKRAKKSKRNKRGRKRGDKAAPIPDSAGPGPLGFGLRMGHGSSAYMDADFFGPNAIHAVGDAGIAGRVRHFPGQENSVFIRQAVFNPTKEYPGFDNLPPLDDTEYHDRTENSRPPVAGYQSGSPSRTCRCGFEAHSFTELCPRCGRRLKPPRQT